VDLQREIQDYLLSEFPTDRTSLDPDENLLGSGLIDSMGLLKLVTHLETRYGFVATEDDMVPDNFATLARMGAFVERKRARP
jgi:acyl carrier protein